MYETLRLDVADGVALLTLTAPEKRNAMTPALTAEFPQAIASVGSNPDVRALVIAGTGTVFCAGGDLAMLERMLGQSPEQNRREMAAFYRAYLGVLQLDVPVIAALTGHAVGAGASFTLACDVRLAAESAKIGFTYVNLGLHPGMGTTHLLPLVTGSDHAADLMLSGRMVTATEALAMRLVTRVLPADQVLPAALALAREMAAKPPSAIRMAKRALVAPKLAGLDAALDYEAAAQMTSYASPEMREALDRMKRSQKKQGIE